MRMKILVLLATLLAFTAAKAQFVLDCACIAQQHGMTVTNCQATIPDICALTTNCFRSSIQPPPPLIIVQCSQTPAVGTPVGPGTHAITVTVTVAGMAPIQCLVPFTVVAPITGPFSLQCAPNKTENCDAVWNFDPPTVVNPCCPNAALPNGGATVTVVSTVTNGVCPQVITRTWQAVDQCGQTATCSQTVTVVDNVPPTISCGPNQTVNCGTPWSFSTPTISDNCTAASDLVLTIVSTVTSGVCPQVITRTWKVADLCGNSATCAETVTVVDGTPPTITCGPNQTVNCGTPWSFSNPTYSDNCTPQASLVLSIVSTTTSGSCPEVNTRIWQVTDLCGNKAICTETVTVQDITAPTITCAPNKSVECGSQWNFDPPTATDNCGSAAGTPNVTIAVVSTVTNGTCPEIITRTWSATDGCGNVSQCSQTVTVVDTTPPVLDCNCLQDPAVVQLTVTGCSNAIPDLCLLAATCARDNCGPLTCSQSPAAGTIVFPGVHPITVTVYDCASNSASCVVNFTVVAPPGGCVSTPCRPTLTGVLNTGTTNGNGGLLPTGAQEQVWVNVAAPGGPIPMVVVDTNLYPIFFGPWLQPTATSAWVSPDVTSQGLAGWYTNRVTFDAGCANVCLKGRIASDDDGYLYVNGVFVSGSGFTAWSNVNHCADFAKGPNVIEFVVHNATGPTGFRTELEFWEQCCCNTYTNVWNTGMDGTNALAVGQPDPNYVLVSGPGGCTGPAQVVGGIPGPWVPNGPNSQWIGGGPNANCDSGVYHYRLCFDLPCVDGASVIGQWTADDFGAVFLNGQLLYSIPNNQFPYSFTGWHPLMLTNGFVCGTNCLDFYVTNAHGVINPTGFRAELTNVFDDCCCGPLQEISSYHSGANAGVLMPQNWPDPQLVLSCAPPGVPTGPAQVAFPNGFWLPNGPDSQWVGPVMNWNAPGGLYCYTYRFDLPPCTNGTPKYAVKGQWAGDDAGTLYVNGNPTGNNLPNGWAFTNWHPISITSGLVPGPNTLTFYVTNASQGDTGIRVELTNYASCCDCVMTNCNVTINCPTDLDVQSCSIVAGKAPVNYPLPTASSTCGVISSIVCTPPSGSIFPLGPTPVNCTATDANGHTASCSFTVYLIGVPPVSLVCPGNITVNSACGQACAVVNYPPPVVTGGALVGCNPPSGTCFPIGTTTVTCRATNICNDRATCTFTVTVLPYTLPCAPVPANLALWLPFDQPTGLTAQNLAGGNVGVLLNGPVHQLGGYVNNSLCFDGVNDYVQVTPYPAIQVGTGDFSVDAWIKPASLNNAIRIIVDHRDEITGPGVVGYSFFLGGANTLAFQIADGTGFANYPSTLSVPADGRWHLVAVTVNRANPNGIRFYVDGVIDSVPRDPTVAPASLTPPPAFPLRISSRSSSLSGFFPGCIDEVELFRRALTPSEITAIYNAGPYGKCRPGSNGVVPPLVIKCPPNQTIFTCTNSATANFKASASGNLGPIVCVPPSGSVFPIGTNTVTCTVTNICGASASCSFLVIVKPYGPFSPFPSATYWGGAPDFYTGTIDPANVSPCMLSALPAAAFVGFDMPFNNLHVGHRFIGLPNNIGKAELIIRMKPGPDPNSSNDSLLIGLAPGCAPGGFLYTQPLALLPGAVPPTGGTWQQPGNGSTTFTLDLATLNPSFIAKLNTDQYLDVVVQDDTVVDFMQLRIWRCPPPIIGTGIPHHVGIGTNLPSVLAVMSAKVLPGFGPIGVGPSFCVIPNTASATKVSEVEFNLGGGNTFSFTTVLDMDAPEGATIEIIDPLDPMGVPLLTLSKSIGCPPPKDCGWDLKKCKGAISDVAGFRTSAVNSDGELLGSFFQTLTEGNTNAALTLRVEDDGVTQFPITITINRDDGTISVTFPGSTELRACCRHKGWDGTIKGRVTDEALRKGWDGTIKGRPPEASMITFTPHKPHPVVAPVLNLVGTGLDEWFLTSEVISTMNGVYIKKLTGALGFASPEDEDATAHSWHQGTAASDGVSVVSLADGSGVTLDLGRAASFNAGLHHFENGDIPDQEQLLRVIGGPIRGLTNRPPPPVLDLRLRDLPGNVACGVDFSPLDATGVRVQLWSNGTLFAEGVNPGPVIGVEDGFEIGRWPQRFAAPGPSAGVRLFHVEMFSIVAGTPEGGSVVVQGDEIRLVPELPAGAEQPEYFSAIQCLGSEGLESLIYDLRRTSACVPAPLIISRDDAGIRLDWSGEGYRLQGAESLESPWLELSARAPVALPSSSPLRVFRLVCE